MVSIDAVDATEPTPPLPHQRFLELARTLPRIPVEDPRMQAILGAQDQAQKDALYNEKFGRFGNNFHFLFEGLRLKRSGEDLTGNTHYEGFYGPAVAKAEALGESWQKFMADTSNQELLARIDAVLDSDTGRGFEELQRYFVGLISHGREAEINALEKAIGHPLGINALAAAYHDKRNPLLREAAQAMKTFGINPEQFYA